MPAGGVRLDGGPVLSENEASALESDVSSIISISDALPATDTEDDYRETHKYRMPDVGKTRLHLRTKEPLSPSPRPVPPSPPRRQNSSTPSTPRTRSAMERPPMHHRNSSVENISDSDYVGSGLSRAGSVYTLGRASFAGQLSQLTTMRLPDAGHLSKHMSEIPTAKEAARALSDASEQIRMWITKASEVLSGLSAEDDVEWAAAGGRDGIDDVDNAINRFEKLVQVYIVSIERLQTRDDVKELSPEDLSRSVKQMESIVSSWQTVKKTVEGIKEQVEVAIEWETLWNTVLGEIAQEMDALNRLVFEMEEKRHQGAESLLSATDSIDLNDLETIVEHRPGQGRPLTNARLSSSTQGNASPRLTAANNDGKEDANLLGLFARMQPLRASLDFLPMRLSSFSTRGIVIFPSACQDLDRRREQLESMWQKLEADAESLRRELGEDRWIVVFRNAGRQALKMCESVSRSYSKLKDGLDAGEEETDVVGLAKKVESFEAKRLHYGPAIGRVLTIIDRGVSDRLTVNGEILRLQSDMKSRWSALQQDMAAIEGVLDEFHRHRDKQLRESVSTVVSSERSLASSLVETPGTSPASSVVGASGRGSPHGSRTPTPLNNSKVRQDESSRRLSGHQLSSLLPRSIPLRRKPSDRLMTPASSPASTRSFSTSTRSTSQAGFRSNGVKPRWSTSTKLEETGFAPLSAYEPSPYAKAPVTPRANFLRATSTAPKTAPSATGRAVSTPQLRPGSSLAGRKSSLPLPSQSTPSRNVSPLVPRTTVRPGSRLGGARRMTSTAADGNEADSESPSRERRPPSALAARLGTKRSLLGLGGKGKVEDATVGAEKPRWRP